MKLVTWLRHNIFPTWYHAIFSALTLALLMLIIPPLLHWAIFNAHFVGSGPEVCSGHGACWVFIHRRFNQFMYGFYPRDLEWRINLSYIIGIIWFMACLYSPSKYKRASIISLCVIFPIIAYILYRGGVFGLEQVDTYSWGGLHLTLVLAFSSILLSLPIGIGLALARCSKLPIVHTVSMLFIELWRGVPLVSVLFMASYVIPLFFSTDIYFDKVLRALVGITLFYSAYMAEEMVRALKTMPRGQFEAANSLALGYFKSMRLVILPQVISKIVHRIVNIFTHLFKDTTLVLIIGLFDLLGMIEVANEDPKWQAYGLEGFVFAAFVYWIFSYSMSRYSEHLLKKLNVGSKA